MAGFEFQVVPAGDAAIAVICGSRISRAAHQRMRRLLEVVREHPLPGVLRWVPGYTVALGYVDAERTTPSEAARALEDVLRLQLADGGGRRVRRQRRGDAPRLVEIPVAYSGQYGPDLAELARGLGLPEDEFARLHRDARYEVYAIGFVPGFPYLAGLPRALAAPRLEQPRIRVPAGSVGIGGRQTGVYPVSTPGGWRLIGRTPLRLFDLARDDPFLLHPGDRVRFTAIPADEFADRARAAGGAPDAAGAPAPSPRLRAVRPDGHPPRFIQVVKSGLLTTVQDLGRAGCEHQGVARAGAMDRFAAAVANLLVGNDIGAAVLECTLVGPALRLAAGAVLCVTGGDLGPHLNGAPLPMWKAVWAPAGSELSFSGYRSGCRAYVAVAGGIDVPAVMNSRSTDLRQGFGGLWGRALRAGDELPLGPSKVPAAQLRGRSLPPWARPVYGDETTVGFLPARLPSAVAPACVSMFCARVWTVSPHSDRMGIRLSGAVIRPPRRQVVSEPVQPGTIQCPPNGQPIVLMADAQTLGGYQTLGVVCSADVGRLAQCRPGARVRFEPVTEAEALAKLRLELWCLRWLMLVNQSLQ